MKIAFIHPRYPGAEGTGATYTATQIVNGLAERGHEVTVYCPEEPPKEVQPSSNLELEYLDFSGFPYHTNSQLNRALRERVGEFDSYDVTNCYISPALPAMEYIGRKTSSATGVTLNAYGAVCPKNDLLFMNEENCTYRSLSRCTKCISATSFGHDEFSAPYRIFSQLGNLRLIKGSHNAASTIDFFRSPSGHVKENHVDFGFQSDKIHTIPHPLNEEFLVEHASDFTEPYKLLYVGYLEKHKGVNKLVPILNGLQEEQNQEVSLTVVGEGGLRSDMEQQARNYGVQNSVDFRGFVPNKQLPTVYASHDIFVYPGIWDEPLARVYLEALGTGTPIVTSEYGEIKSIVSNGGVTVDGSTEEFILAINDIILEDRLEQLSNGANNKAKEYKLKNILPEIERVYSEKSKIAG